MGAPTVISKVMDQLGVKDSCVLSTGSVSDLARRLAVNRRERSESFD